MTQLLERPLVLPPDVVITPATEFEAEARERLGAEADEFALTRVRSRDTSKIIGPGAAELLRRFREPTTFVQAVAALSRARSEDAERLLDVAAPLVIQLIASGMLVPADAAAPERTTASLTAGADAVGFEVVRCVQILEDSEVYLARHPAHGFAAVKLAREGYRAIVEPQLAREAAVLRRLDGKAGPPLLGAGDMGDRPYLAVGWCHGIDAAAAAVEARELGDPAALLALLGGIAAAYAALHAQGVLHGDVHPRNLLVDGWGKVTPIDFGLARLADEPDAANLRGGATFYTDPGFAAAVMAGRAPPGLDAVAEQFSLCALLYHLATGRHYVDFDLQSERMLQQIVESRPRPFAALDRPSWPDLEATLARGLEKAPEDRFGDTAQLAAALASIVPPTAATKLDATPLRAECRSFVDDLVRELDFDSRLFRDGLAPPPTASVSFGAAGVAYGMLRLAGARLQPELTATADAWLLRARRATATADAFANEGMDVRPETIGPISPYYTLSGVHLVGALLADAMADGPAVDAGVEAFLDASAVPCSGRDVTLGRAGTALASLLALEGLAQLGDEPRQGLRACAEARLVQLWAELPPAETVANSASWPNLGVAHGWAGLLYVTLRWLASLEEPGAHPLAESVRSRLEELAGCAWPSGRGMALPWRDRPGPSEASMPGWCNGAAGLVHVGCEARRVLGDERYLELAERAAWQAWESESLAIDLCCGLGGRAYALLELHRCGGGAAWRRKAERLALGAVRAAPEQRNAEHPRHSLLKGELGLALLCADLERPEVAAMPFFGREPLAILHGQGGIERPGSRSGLQEEP